MTAVVSAIITVTQTKYFGKFSMQYLFYVVISTDHESEFGHHVTIFPNLKNKSKLQLTWG